MFIHSPIVRYKSKSAVSGIEMCRAPMSNGTLACEKMRRGQRRCIQREKERKSTIMHGRMCDPARRRHDDVSCSSGLGRSFDVQLIRDRNRDSSESASRFETGSGRRRGTLSCREANFSRVHVRARIRADAASHRQVSRLSE